MCDKRKQTLSEYYGTLNQTMKRKHARYIFEKYRHEEGYYVTDINDLKKLNNTVLMWLRKHDLIDLELNDIYEFDHSKKLFFEYLHLALENNYQFPTKAYAYFVLMFMCSEMNSLTNNNHKPLETPINLQNIEYNISIVYSNVMDIFNFPQVKSFFDSEYIPIDDSDISHIVFHGDRLTPNEYWKEIERCEKRIKELNLNIKFPKILL